MATRRLNDFTVSGDVGIGTTTPLTPLHVSSADDVLALLISTDEKARIEFADNNTTGSIRPSIGASGNNTIFTHGTTERMRIDSSGKVGIGTTSPGRKLSVAGGLELTEADTTLNTLHASVRRGSSGEMFLDAPGHIIVNIDSNQNNTDRYFSVAKDAGTELFRVQEDGNVGIGTTSPSSALHIVSSIDQILTLQSNDDGAVYAAFNRGTDRHAYFGFGGANDNFKIVNEESTGTVQLGTNGTTRVTIDSSGDVGINTTSPSVTLDISATDAVQLPVGTTAQRPTAAAGMIRYNSTDGSFEGYTSEWGAIGGGDDFSLKSITKNASNEFPITFADSTNFKLSASGTWTITATIASGDVGKSGIILIVNTAATTPGALPSTFKTPNGDNIVFETDSGDYSVISYFIASTTHVLVNYVGNFS